MKSENRSNFYLINKPKTWTSQDLCSKFKCLYRFNKVGHAGTLDPNAEGLMLVATDKYTKLFNYTNETDKTYKVTALFGYSSDSLDTDTQVIQNEANFCTSKSVLDLKLPLNEPSVCSFNKRAILDSLASLTTSIRKSVSAGVVVYFL